MRRVQAVLKDQLLRRNEKLENDLKEKVNADFCSATFSLFCCFYLLFHNNNNIYSILHILTIVFPVAHNVKYLPW